MDIINELVSNYIIIASFISIILTQILKVITNLIVNHKIDLSRLTNDGGMPSAHSAAVSSLATMCGLTFGFNSGIFSISLVFAVITCHDAMNSRQQIGKQAAVINKLFRDMLNGKDTETNIVLKELVGHTPLQVFMGILLGIFVSIMVFYNIRNG